MGVNSGIYKFLLVLHLIAVIVGFGNVILGGIYGNLSKKRGGTEGVAISEANYFVITRFAEPFIYAVPVLGILLILTSDDVWKFDQTWISLSLLLWIVGAVLSRVVMIRSHRRINELTAELATMGPPPAGTASGAPPQVAEIEELGKRMAMTGGLLHLILVAVIALMVWKPGL